MKRVAAVVVTYNRLPLLQRLLERLDGVDGLDEVLVVDNASTDGTGEWLASLEGPGDTGDAHRSVPVVARTLTENTGGAGGFAAGLSWATERGADLAWLMDDDGVPAPDCLARLLAVEGYDFWGPVVVDEAAPDRLVFPIRLPGSTRVAHDVASVERAAVDGVLGGIVIPFNGVLVTRELVERIGVPRAEFFIWGDDHEYRLRAEAAGARIGTVTAARFEHPSVGELGTPMMGGRTTYNHTPSDLKHYCMARNNTVNLRDYRGWAHVVAFWLKTVWFYLFTRRDPGRIALSAKGAYAGLRGDFSGHARLLRAVRASTPGPETVAIVVVTYNRAELLANMLAGLERLDRRPDAVIVVDNASTDTTAEVLKAWSATGEGRQVITSPDNLGGAGGFRAGMKAAYEQGFDRIWLMDDDVIPAPECLDVLMSEDEDCLMVVREDGQGRLAEYAATRFDLRNPLAIKPKTASVVSTYPDRAAMPRRVELENVAFEGFMVRRSVIDDIGLPDDSFFIFYDDVDFALRARATGRRIWALRDAVVVRQLDFSQQHDLAGWKGFYMYRNLFAVHFRYGENPLVRAKPYAIAAGVTLLKPREARNVTKALLAARGMRTAPRPSVD